MAYLIVHHTVQDYGKWKPVYDEDQVNRKASGIKCEQLFRSTDDPNDVTILFEVSDINRVRQFIQSDELRKTMQRGGVIGMPEFHFLEEVETHELVKPSM